MTEAFVYCWTDHSTHKLYVGFHKGDENDGYVSSSKYFMKEYVKRPQDFTRTIIARGNRVDMLAFESVILTASNAAKSDHFYNKNNGRGHFICESHSVQTRKKMSASWKKRGVFNCDSKKALAVWTGQTHTDESKAKMRKAAEKHSEARRDCMTKNNPMKNPETIAKMLTTRKKNKELR